MEANQYSSIINVMRICSRRVDWTDVRYVEIAREDYGSPSHDGDVATFLARIFSVGGSPQDVRF